MWSNFHTHSKYCDGKGELADYVRQAKSLRMMSLGFSSHAPLPFPCLWSMDPEHLKEYLQAVEELRKATPELEVYKSLEIDFIPGLLSTNHYRKELDYSIGSIHFVDQFPDGRHWEIDGLHSHFREGLDLIFGGDLRAAITRYFELTREMILHDCPTIIGHLDKIKIQNKGDLFSEQDPWYQMEVRKTLALIAESQAIVEVNTRGIYQKKSATTYPSPWILTQLLEHKIPITLSSDAHHKDDLTNQFSETAHLLATLGFRKLMVLRDGSWSAFTFNAHGLEQ